MLDALLFTKTSPLLAAVYKDCLWKIETDKKALYLTFDDGPIPDVTPFVLDELKKYGAKATFFCIGKNIEANPEIFQRIKAEGHIVGNHSYNHLNGWMNDNKTYFADIEKCEGVLSGHKHAPGAKLFRPPYGKLKPAQYQFLKKQYRIVMWDVLSFDFDLKISEEKVLQNVIENAEAGSIIVFHDSLKAKKNMEYALPRVLEHFTRMGFSFESVG